MAWHCRFLNEQIENLAASAKGKTQREFQGHAYDPVNATTKPAHTPERPISKKPSFSGLEMIDLHPKPTQEGSEILMSSKKHVDKLSASGGDFGTFSKMQHTAATGGVNLKYTREVRMQSDILPYKFLSSSDKFCLRYS